MRSILLIIAFSVALYSCNTNKTTIEGDSDTISQTTTNDTIRISNEELEYEIIIVEVGFDAWLVTQPPMGHYGLSYLENKNRLFVIEYNIRVSENRNHLLYEQAINYESVVHYGLEVNYLLYNYFVYFQHKYNQKL